MASRRYGTSPRAGTSFTKEELEERGVKKLVIYAKHPTWAAIDALAKLWKLKSSSAVVARLAADAAKKAKIEIDE